MTTQVRLEQARFPGLHCDPFTIRRRRATSHRHGHRASGSGGSTSSSTRAYAEQPTRAAGFPAALVSRLLSERSIYGSFAPPIEFAQLMYCPRVPPHVTSAKYVA